MANKEETRAEGIKVFMTLDTVSLYRVTFSDIRGRKLEISRDDWSDLGHTQGISAILEAVS